MGLLLIVLCCICIECEVDVLVSSDRRLQLILGPDGVTRGSWMACVVECLGWSVVRCMLFGE